MSNITLVQTLAKPINGYWDGGAKSRFEWEIDGRPQSDNKGQYVRIGSWQANTWFNVAVGKTDKQTLSYAKKHLQALMNRKGIECKFEYRIINHE